MGTTFEVKGCEPWCGLRYSSDRVPIDWSGPNELPWGVHAVDGAMDPAAYCTAACLGRARANHPEKPESSAKREPVAPWVRFAKPGVHPEHGRWLCTTGSDECAPGVPSAPAIYGHAGYGACEACAESAGVFGPVADCQGTSGEVPKVADRRADDPREAKDPGNRPPGIRPPACAGPLATHGTPVLRALKRAFRREAIMMFMCDACFMDNERQVEALTKDQEALVSLGEHDGKSSDPPARIGEVPQSLGPMRGIWASRGMR